MATRQKNRGPHPADQELFSKLQWPALQQAAEHLSWLLSHGYAAASSLKLVGDRFSLVSRQRTAVMRSACSDASVARRQTTAIRPDELAGIDLEIDALNVLITLESALSGGVILLARDEGYRDMASVHGSYRKVVQTQRAIELAGQFLCEHDVRHILWRIDRPISNSGRLRALLSDHAAENGFSWDVRLDDDPDRVLGTEHQTVVSSDSVVMDHAVRWANLARWIIDATIDDPWVVPMARDINAG